MGKHGAANTFHLAGRAKTRVLGAWYPPGALDIPTTQSLRELSGNMRHPSFHGIRLPQSLHSVHLGLSPVSAEAWLGQSCKHGTFWVRPL
jgi:hypothetical protein